jgi:hypothetical protein
LQEKKPAQQRDEEDEEQLQKKTAPCAALASVRVEGADGSTVRLAGPAEAMDAIVKAAAAHDVVDLTSQPADLEEIFLELYREPAGAD